jgi:hypothetical protein
VKVGNLMFNMNFGNYFHFLNENKILGQGKSRDMKEIMAEKKFKLTMR